ncbi:actin-related protein 2/3 complex subunit 3 [Bisporella sp. PMI_857]|nr:actin-related protein 2/3 complex subunit 3 [Bisporella sp. PMI_857]
MHHGQPYLTTTTAKMPAYNSIFNTDTSPQLIGTFPLLPLRTKTRGPAYTLPLLPSLPPSQSPEPDDDSYDALDEVLSLFRANTFFRNFEIQGPADRLLVYGILWVSECLGKIRNNMSGREAQKEVSNIALDTNFAIPGDPGFPLNQIFTPPSTRQEAEVLRQYLMQVRQELATRLLARIYEDGTDKPSKWWLSFAKRKFMGKSL